MGDFNIKKPHIRLNMRLRFFTWEYKYNTGAKYMFCSVEECSEARWEIDEINKTIIPVKGTMKIHHVASVNRGVIIARFTSCYCTMCLNCHYHDYAEKTLLKEQFRMPDTYMIEQIVFQRSKTYPYEV